MGEPEEIWVLGLKDVVTLFVTEGWERCGGCKGAGFSFCAVGLGF